MALSVWVARKKAIHINWCFSGIGGSHIAQLGECGRIDLGYERYRVRADRYGDTRSGRGNTYEILREYREINYAINKGGAFCSAFIELSHSCMSTLPFAHETSTFLLQCVYGNLNRNGYFQSKLYTVRRYPHTHTICSDSYWSIR